MTRRLLAVALAGSLLAATAADAGRPASGTYSGRTSQGMAIRIEVDGRHLGNIVFKVTDSCDRPHASASLADTTRISPDGRFSFRAGSETHLTRVRGRFHGRRATGVLSENVALADGRDCRSGRVRFTVTRR